MPAARLRDAAEVPPPAFESRRSLQQIHPKTIPSVDAVELYRLAPRSAPGERPWILLSMIHSADGAAVLDGRVGGLGEAGDREVFFGLRGIADVVVAAAGTVRAESYGPVVLPEEVREARAARGQREIPPIAVVSASLDLDWNSRLFTESDPRPIVVTAEDADAHAMERARSCADVIAIGKGHADLRGAFRELRRRGFHLADCEGGPMLNGALLAEDLVDELAVSVAPKLLGGDAIRIIRGMAPDTPRAMTLAHVLEDDGYLFLRYVRANR